MSAAPAVNVSHVVIGLTSSSIQYIQCHSASCCGLSCYFSFQDLQGRQSVRSLDSQDSHGSGASCVSGGEFRHRLYGLPIRSDAVVCVSGDDLCLHVRTHRTSQTDVFGVLVLPSCFLFLLVLFCLRFARRRRGFLYCVRDLRDHASSQSSGLLV